MGCPPEEAVLAFLDGTLGPDEQAAINLHLSGCASCARLFAVSIDLTFANATPEPAADSEEKRPPLESNGRIGRYVVGDMIGAGAMGVVYSATDPELGRQVALKLLRAGNDTSGEASARLLREAQAMARVSHPNVVAVYDTGTWRSQVFIAMELVEGTTLAAWRRAKPRGWREIVAVFLHAGQGLAAAHAAGLVHRDFKPENVLISEDGRVRVTDFGLVRIAAESAPEPGVEVAATPSASALSPHSPLSQAGMLIGSPAYMSPEQMNGRAADVRSDVFSFCVALFECLSGERPFAGETLRELHQSIERGQIRKITKSQRVPASIQRLLQRGLDLNPEKRPQSMELLLEELARDPAVARYGAAAFALLAVVCIAGAIVARGSSWHANVESLPATYEENTEPLVLSPDGTLLAYASDRGDRRRWRLYLEPVAGGEGRAITQAGARPHCARFSRDGQSLVYVDQGSDEARRLRIADGAIEVLASDVECIEECGGSGLLLQRGGAPDCPTCERITLLSAGAERDVVRLAGRHIRPVRCDKSGSQFVFASVSGASSEIRVGSLDGRPPRTLVQSDDALADPVFAVDGRSVIYAATVDARMNLFEIPLAGGEARRLTDGPGPDLGPEPSPDGSSLFFQFDNTPRQFFSIQLATGLRQRISARLQEMRYATFTLDGRSIIAQVQRAGGTQLVELLLDGSAERVLANGAMPDLTADDREVIFTRPGANGGWRLLAVPRLGGEPRLIAEGEGLLHDLLVGADSRVHLRVDRGERRSAFSAPLSGGAATLEAPEPWSVVVPLASGHRLGLRAGGFYDRVFILPPGLPAEAGPIDPRVIKLPARMVSATRDQRSIVYHDGLHLILYTPSNNTGQVLYEYGLPSEFGLSADGKSLLLGEFIGGVQRRVMRNFGERPR